MRVNGTPLELVEPATLRLKTFEPILLLGRECFSDLDIRIRVRGGGHVAQVYAIRQALAKAVVAFHQKCAYARCPGAPMACAGRGVRAMMLLKFEIKPTFMLDTRIASLSRLLPPAADAACVCVSGCPNPVR